MPVLTDEHCDCVCHDLGEKGAEFVRGFAAAAATLARDHGRPSLAVDLLRLNGIGLDDLRWARVEDFDLAPLRKEMKP